MAKQQQARPMRLIYAALMTVSVGSFAVVAADEEDLVDSRVRELVEDYSTSSKPRWDLVFEAQGLSKGHALEFSSQSEGLVHLATDGTCSIWHVDSGQRTHQFKVNTEHRAVGMTSDMKHLLLGGKGQTVEVWRPGRKKPKKVFTHEGFDSEITSIRVSADDERFMVTTANGRAGCYPIREAEGFLTPEQEGARALAVSPDFDLRVAAFEDSRMQRVLCYDEAGEVKAGASFAKYVSGKITHADVMPAAIAVANSSRLAVLYPDFSNGMIYCKSFANLDGTPLLALAGDPESFFFTTIDAGGKVLRFDGAHPTSFGLEQLPGTGLGSTAPALSQAAIDPFAATVAAISGSTLRVHYLEHDGGLDRRSILDRMRELLVNERYAAFQATKKFLGEGSIRQLQGPRLEAALTPHMSGVAARQVTAAFDKWSNVEPVDPYPNLVLASYYHAVGWEFRGEGPGSAVPPDRYRAFRAYVDHATKYIHRVDDLEVVPSGYFPLKLSLLMAERGGNGEEFEKTVARLLKVDPGNVDAHNAAAYYLTPRWHGEPGDSEKYARRIADHVKGKKGEALYANVAAGLLHLYSRDDYTLRTRFDHKRIQDYLSYAYKAEKRQQVKDQHLAFRVRFAARAFDDILFKELSAEIESTGWLNRNAHRTDPVYTDAIKSIDLMRNAK